MEKMREAEKFDSNINSEENKNKSEKKSKSKNTMVVIDCEEEEKEKKNTEKADYDVENEKSVGANKKLNDLSENMMGYLSGFYRIEDLATLNKLSRKIRTRMVGPKKPSDSKQKKLLQLFFENREELKKCITCKITQESPKCNCGYAIKIYKPLSGYFGSIPDAFFERLEDMSIQLTKEDYLMKAEIDYLLQAFMCHFIKCEKIEACDLFANSNSEVRNKMTHLLMKFNKCPFTQIQLYNTENKNMSLEGLSNVILQTAKELTFSIENDFEQFFNVGMTERISKSKSLRKVSIKYYPSDEEDLDKFYSVLKPMIKAIVENPLIYHLGLGSIDEVAHGIISDALYMNESIKCLSFNWCSLLDYQFINHSQIDSLEFHYLDLTKPSTLKLITEILNMSDENGSKSAKIKNLSIYLNTQCLVNLDLFLNIPTITRLELILPKTKLFKDILKVLSNNTTLQILLVDFVKLDFTNCADLFDKNSFSVFRALPPNLKELHIKKMKIRSDYYEEFKDSLVANTSLEKVRLDWNKTYSEVFKDYLSGDGRFEFVREI